MALTEKEKQLVEYAKNNGKTPAEAKAAIARYRKTNTAKEEIVQQKKSVGDKAMTVLDTVLGGGKIGEAIGTKIAEATATPEEKAAVKEFGGKTFEGPSSLQVAGDVLRTGATFIPVGKIAGVAGKVAGKLGLGKAAQVAGNVVTGGLTGVAADIGVSLSEEGTPKIGFGTALGAGIPAVSPVVGAISRATTKLTGKVATETTGILTGTSQETIESAFNAARKGGTELETFTNALRGKTTPEQLVNNVRESVDIVKQGRNTLFKETLSELSDEVVPTDITKNSFKETLNKFKIAVSENGQLDFSKSELRTVPAAQNKIVEAWSEIQRMPQSISIGDLDTTRQAVKAIKLIAGDDPSSNKANALIEDAVRSIRKAGEQVDGYGTMLDNFSESSEFLAELERGLSTGDRATIDQAYRRLATTLKTNNEQRKALLEELDAVTGGALLSDISGQQLSEWYPRGIFRQILAGGATVSAASGAISPALLPSLVLASPRVVGEFARAVGISANKIDGFVSAIDAARNLLIKAGAITGSEVGV